MSKLIKTSSKLFIVVMIFTLTTLFFSNVPEDKAVSSDNSIVLHSDDTNKPLDVEPTIALEKIVELTPIPTATPTPTATPKPTAIPTKVPTPTPTRKTVNLEAVKMSNAEVKEYVKNRALKEFGWSGAEWDALEFIVTKESSWNYLAVNKSSGACGLFQALPCSKMGNPWDSIEVQTNFGLNYIKNRYKTPIGAKAFWQQKHWY